MSLPNLNRPTLAPLDTLDKTKYVIGTLSPIGLAELDVEVTNSERLEEGLEEDGLMNTPLTNVDRQQVESPADSSTESDEIENYDEQLLDASAVIEGSRGGEKVSRCNPNLVEDYASFARRPSIPIILEKTEKKGCYLLTADDPEIRDIIQKGLEREQKLGSTSITQRTNPRDLVFTRRFTAFDRTNSTEEISPFHGFFTLFWIGTGLTIVRVAAHNWRAYGNIFGHNEILTMMFGRDFFVMALTDALLCGSTVFVFLLQLLVFYGFINWNRSGWIMQHLWQTAYLGCAIGWTFYRKWPWTHTIFIVLHSMVFLMKQHSYAAYNGYLSHVYKRKLALENTLRKLDDISLTSNQMTFSATTDSSLAEHLIRRAKTEQVHQTNNPRRRRKTPSPPKRSASMPHVNLSQEPSEITSVSETVSSGKPLDSEQINHIKEIISAELDALNAELRGKCSVTQNYYPSNLTIKNFAEWTCLPTLVYELEYPRQDRINWSYVAEKTAATFGVLGVMQVVSQAYIYPLVIETIRMKEAGVSVQDRWQETPWIILDLLFPLMLEHLLSWYVIWECVLNVLAEVTCFADRGFYGDWWNSVTFADYARDWNKPVHNFLLRHVYHSSISAFHLSKTSAMIVTFLLSACVHELVMFCLFHKIRGYLFLMQLLQLPLAALSRTRHLKDRKVMGNIVFWFGIFVGPSIITGLYLVV